MLYFAIDQTKPTESNFEVEAVYVKQPIMARYITRNDFQTYFDAMQVADSASKLGVHYIATDEGLGVWPRFDVIELPKVGNKVSRSFNGDSYPDGEIVSISAGLKVITTTSGSRYRRRGDSGCWIEKQTWSLIPDHITERNPSSDMTPETINTVRDALYSARHFVEQFYDYQHPRGNSETLRKVDEALALLSIELGKIQCPTPTRI